MREFEGKSVFITAAVHSRRRRRPWGRLALAAVVAGLNLVPASAFTVDIGAGEVECYILVVEKDATIVGNFEVLSSGPLAPIKATVMQKGDGDKPAVQRWNGSQQPEGSFNFDADMAGEYELCLGNGQEGNDDGLLRTIGFAFRTGGLDPDEHPEVAVANADDEAAAAAAAAAAGRLEDLVESAEDLMEGLNTFLDHQSYMRTREEVHRATMESTNARVLWWTVTEAAVLLCLAIWQISYISSCFETKRAL